MRIELKEKKPGYAEFSATGWKGGDKIELAILRNQDNCYFSHNNQWNKEPVWHVVTDFSVNDGKLSGELGPNIIDALVQQSSNVRYMIQVKDGSVEDNGSVKFVGNILASSASGDTSREADIRQAPPVVEPIPEPEPELVPEPEPEPEIEPIPDPVVESAVENTAVPEVPPAKKSKLGLIIGLLILLLAIAGGVAYFLLGQDSPKALAACELDSAPKDDLAFIQTCLKTNPDSQALLKLIEQAKQNKACGLAQRLYANKAQSGDSVIALAYAKEYDDAFSKGDGCFKLDKETAVYWYEIALEKDPNNAEAKTRLDALKK
ncbi:hypothetical protein [Lonepinella sp. BR2474]|uniref:hypothetical protein n=1 Tax=Lonepinella sp. BR2474 TaxID=3434548 RepID=UPI003F6DC419